MTWSQLTLSGRSGVFFLSLLFGVTAVASAAKPAKPDWLREGTTVGGTLVASKIELTAQIRKQWAAAGFAAVKGQAFPRFLDLPGYWSYRDVKDHKDRLKTFEFATAGESKVYVGLADRFGGRPLNGECKLWAVDAAGKRTPINYNDRKSGVVTLTEKQSRNQPRVYEYGLALPAGTAKLVIEDIYTCELWQMAWVDKVSRIELVGEAFGQLGEMSQLVEAAARRQPKIGRDGYREFQRAKVCYGLWAGYADLARRYYWGLPASQQERIDAMVPDRSKVDRKALLAIRDRYIRYYTEIEPMQRQYRSLAPGTQLRNLKRLIEEADGVVRSKAMLPEMPKLIARASQIEKGLHVGDEEAVLKIDEMVAEVQRIKRVFDLECRVRLAAVTLDYVQERKPLPVYAQKVAALADRAARAKPEAFAGLIVELKALRREVLFQHPDLQFAKLLICKNPRPGPGHMCDQYYGRHARQGQGLFVLENWQTDTPTETCITEGLPAGAFHHPDVSYDGKRVAFGFCDVTVRESRKRRFWIYEAAIDGSGVRQLTGTLRDPMVRVDGRKSVVVEDWDPCYLPDGGLAFISTRCQGYGRCHGDRYVPAYMLYRMDANGTNVRRLSYGEANEWDPAVLDDGRIVYTRWDYINRHDTRYQGLWVTRPDGTKTEHYYGSYSPSPCMSADNQPIAGTGKIVSLATDHHGYTQGSITIIDVSKGEDGHAPLTVVTPEISFPEAGYDVMDWMGKLAVPVVDSTSTTGLRNRSRAMAPYSINEELFLCAYSGQNGYAIMLVDTMGGREVIYDKAECTAAIPVLPRMRPPIIPSQLPANPKSNTGTLVVQDVYENRHVSPANPLPAGSIKALRVNQIFTQPARTHWSRGWVLNEVVKRPLGTVPVEPDGSVALEAPAGVPLQLQALDENGLAVMTMRSFIYLHPGERQSCVGCHENRTTSPVPVTVSHERIRQIRPTPGTDYDGGLSFVRTVQPVLDRHCIGCHGLGGKSSGGKTAPGNFVFAMKDVGSKYGQTPRSYGELLSRAKVRLAPRNRETVTSVPRDYFSATSRLPKMLLAGHNGLKIDRDSLERIVSWMDVNGQCYGTYLPNRPEQRLPDPDGEAALRAYVKELFGEAMAAQPLGALVNPAEPAESRILMAPLAIAAGGWGQIHTGYLSKKDSRYTKMRDLADKAYHPMSYHSIDGTCGRPRCICGNCWIREMVDAGQYRKDLKAKAAGKTLVKD